MSRPCRPSDPENATGRDRTFFVTTRTAGGRSLFQSVRMTDLLVEVLRSYMRNGKFIIHDFVAMPNHLHVLLTIPGTITIEKAVQLIKGTFSYRAKKELGFNGEIWQRGFSDVRVTDEGSFREHQKYIDDNPVKAGLVGSPLEYHGGSAYLKNLKRAANSRG